MTTTRTPIPAIDPMVTNILAVYRNASPAQLAEGLAWYQTAHELAVILADSHDGDVLKAAGVISALSPRVQWTYNQTLAIKTYAEKGITGGALGVNIRKADAIYNGAPVYNTLKAPKTVAFAQTIADPTDAFAVVIDRHAVSVAIGRCSTDDDTKDLGRRGFYEAYASAYRIAAARVGISPSQMQAVTWVAWRETSIRTAASVRRIAGRAA